MVGVGKARASRVESTATDVTEPMPLDEPGDLLVDGGRAFGDYGKSGVERHDGQESGLARGRLTRNEKARVAKGLFVTVGWKAHASSSRKM